MASSSTSTRRIKMTQIDNTCRFSSEVELAKYLGSIDVIPDAYQAISETNSTYELHTNRRSGINVLAYSYSPDYYTTPFLEGKFGLVPSEKYPVVDFISTKVNSSFFINEAAVEPFQKLGDDIKELENKHITTSLIITGSGLGGYLAILSTLRLHHAIDVEESKGSKQIFKRPMCITFGCPLVGDEALQRAIAQRPRWKSSLLNVVAKRDRVASSLSSDVSYKPLGTFLFCTESGGHSAFEDHDSIIPVLKAMKLSIAGNLQTYDYTNVLSLIKRKALYRGVSELGEFDLNSLRAGITMQLREVGVLDDIRNDQIGEMEKKQIEIIGRKNSYEPTKELNQMKINLTFMEWYMKTRKAKGGYYDVYKNDARDEIESRKQIVVIKGHLNQYWKKTVEDKDQMPQKQEAKLRKRWLYDGTNYRRIVEPMDIGEHYKNCKINYIENRPDHYKLLEKWFDEDKKDTKSSELKRSTAASLTEDSCFWAHVEEALISLREFVNEGSADFEQKLVEFEAYVMGAINDYTVSPDIFVEGSSLMRWWNEYKAHKGTADTSKFYQYMNNKSYRSYK